MNNVHAVAPISNAGDAQPVCPEFISSPRTVDRFPLAYRACREHPAYRDTAEIQKQIEMLRTLCKQFTETYTPDTMLDFLGTLGIDCDDMSDDFDSVHQSVSGALWLLDMLRGSVCPSLVLPFDMNAGDEGSGE